MAERLSIRVEKSKYGTTTEWVSLIGKNREVLVHGEIYPKGAFYSVSWFPKRSPEKLASLAEECMAYYESHYPDGLKSVSGKVVRQQRVRGDTAYFKGIIFSAHGKDGKWDREEHLSFKRPFSWEQIKTLAEGRRIGFARINSPIADFYIEQQRRFGILSNLKETDGFVQLMEKSLDGKVSHDRAKEFFGVITSRLQR